MDHMLVMHGYNKQETRWWMLPKCALSMKVRTYNPTPLVHQVKKLINTPPLTANYQATNSFWNHLHTIRKSRNV